MIVLYIHCSSWPNGRLIRKQSTFLFFFLKHFRADIGYWLISTWSAASRQLRRSIFYLFFYLSILPLFIGFACQLISVYRFHFTDYYKHTPRTGVRIRLICRSSFVFISSAYVIELWWTIMNHPWIRAVLAGSNDWFIRIFHAWKSKRQLAVKLLGSWLCEISELQKVQIFQRTRRSADSALRRSCNSYHPHSQHASVCAAFTDSRLPFLIRELNRRLYTCTLNAHVVDEIECQNINIDSLTIYECKLVFRCAMCISLRKLHQTIASLSMAISLFLTIVRETSFPFAWNKSRRAVPNRTGDNSKARNRFRAIDTCSLLLLKTSQVNFSGKYLY